MVIASVIENCHNRAYFTRQITRANSHPTPSSQPIYSSLIHTYVSITPSPHFRDHIANLHSQTYLQVHQIFFHRNFSFIDAKSHPYCNFVSRRKKYSVLWAFQRNWYKHRTTFEAIGRLCSCILHIPRSPASSTWPSVKMTRPYSSTHGWDDRWV